MSNSSKNSPFRKGVSSDSEASKEISCAVCLDFYKQPKLLPMCGHSFCLDCILKGVQAGSYSCPECRTVYKINETGARNFPTNISLQRAVELFKEIDAKAELETTMPLVDNSPGEITAANDTCFHLTTCKSPLSCPHCGLKFCRSCQTAHKERIRVEVLSLANNLELHKQNAVKVCSEKFAAFRQYVEDEVKRTEQSVIVEFQELEDGIRQILALRRNTVISAIRESGKNLTANIKTAMADRQKSQQLPESLLQTVTERSVLTLTVDELAKMHTSTVKLLQEVDDVGKLCDMAMEQKLVAANEDTLRRNVCELLCAPIPKGHVEWKEKDECEKPLVQEAVKILHSACKLGDLKMVKQVLERQPPWSPETLKVLVLQKYCDNTPLMLATGRGDIEIVRYFVKDVTKFVTIPEQDVIDCAFLATSRGFVNVLQLLLDCRPSLYDARDNSTSSALIHHAAYCGYIDALKLLLKGRSSLLEAEGKMRHTPLHYAIKNGRVDAVRFLLENGANACAREEGSQKTSLHLAVDFDSFTIVRMLVDRKPDLVYMKDAAGLTPAELANCRYMKDIGAFLQNRTNRRK